MPDRQHSERDLFYSAADLLNQAYRDLGDAADCLRGLGVVDALNAIGEAKDAINRAKGVIRA